MNEKNERNKKEGKKKRKQCLVTFYQIALRRLEIDCNIFSGLGSQVALVVKYLPAGDGGDWGQALHWEDALEEGMATHSRILAWRILWTEEPGRLQSIGLQRVGHS